jgi:hypothetical protein
MTGLDSILMFFLLSFVANGSPQERLPVEFVAAAQRSVALIQARSAGGVERSTGFVLESPSGRRIILTSAHVLRGGFDVSACFPEASSGHEPIPLALVDFSEEFDLVAMVPKQGLQIPNDVSSFQVGRSTDISHLELPRVFVFGRPGGLASARAIPGLINDAHILAEDLPGTSKYKAFNDNPTPGGKTMLIQHTVNSVHGMSGGPLVDITGKVLGVQTGCMPNANEVSYAVDIRHFFELDLDGLPDPDFQKALAMMKTPPRNAMTLTSYADAILAFKEKPVLISTLNYGEVGCDSTSMIEKFIGDSQYFRSRLGVSSLDRFLESNSISLVGSPELGVRFLVPEGYTVATASTTEPDGVRFRVHRSNSKKDTSVSIFLIPMSEYLAPSNENMRGILRDLVIASPANNLDPVLSENVGQAAINAEVAIRRAIAHFERSVLRGSSPTEDGSFVTGADPGLLHDKTIVTDFGADSRNKNGVPFVRLTSTYTNTKDGSGHVLCGTSSGDWIVLVHSRRESIDFSAAEHRGDIPIEAFVQELIQSSVWFY